MALFSQPRPQSIEVLRAKMALLHFALGFLVTYALRIVCIPVQPPGSYRLDQIYMGSSGRELPLIIGLHPPALTATLHMAWDGFSYFTAEPVAGNRMVLTTDCACAGLIGIQIKVKIHNNK